MNASNTHVMIDQQTTWTTNSNGMLPVTMMPPSALFVSEILNIVFQYLEELDLRSLASTSKSSSLARCARTCKAWKELALKLIWESLDSLLPLMKLFPQDAFAAGSRKQPALWGFKRSLRPRDWEAFAKYAPLVRHLAFREGKNVVSSVLIALDVQRPAKYRSAPFFPNLITLRWTVTNNNTITLCTVLASPSLKSITISILGADRPEAERNDATCGLLSTLVDIAPGLTDVHLNINKLWAVSDIVTPLNSLQELHTLVLDIGSIAPFILRGICSHPTLTKLHLDLCEMDDSFLKHLVGNSPQPGDFPALKELSIAADMHIINQTLLLVLSGHLQRVAISTYSLVLPEELSLCLQYLAHVSPSLLELRITTSFESNYDALFKKLVDSAGRYVLTMSDLLPLTVFKQMETLSIQLGYPVSLDDTDVAILVAGLPIVKEFTLCPAVEWVPVWWKPNATLRCLEWIAGNAKSLRSLGLSVDATTIPAPVQVQDDIQMAVMVRDVNPRSPPTPPLTPGSSLVMNESMGLIQVQIPSLETLFVGVSPIAGSNAIDIIAWLSQTFPSLRVVRSSSLLSRGVMEDPNGTTERIWDEVARAFKQEGATSHLPRRGHVEVIELMDPGADMDMEMDTCPTVAADIRVSDGLDGEEYW